MDRYFRFDGLYGFFVGSGMTDNSPDKTPEEKSKEKVLSPAAKRALAEAEARRKAREDTDRPAEKSGPKGVEPTRYGDWERGGIAYDF